MLRPPKENEVGVVEYAPVRSDFRQRRLLLLCRWSGVGLIVNGIAASLNLAEWLAGDLLDSVIRCDEGYWLPMVMVIPMVNTVMVLAALVYSLRWRCHRSAIAVHILLNVVLGILVLRSLLLLSEQYVSIH